MKVIYDKQTGTLLDAAHVLIGDIDPMEQVTDEEMITEVLAQDRPLYEFENEKAAVTVETNPEQFLVWVCYITDNYGNPLVVKVAPTKKKALEWLSDAPHAIGKKDDDKVRGHRFVESFVLESD